MRARAGAIDGAGFTLIELLIAVALGGLVAALALPSYSQWIASTQLANAAAYLAQTLSVARGEAIKRNLRVNVCKTNDGRQCTDQGAWDAGWIMFVDADRSGDIGIGEAVLHVEGPAQAGITVSGNRPVADYVSYTSLGTSRMLNGALQMGTFVVCKSGQNAIDIVLANGGRARIQKTKRPCP
ncbi:MAG TPA: GspH/FimT family pseudopilin [Casimicrobiaceae bacterium]